MAIIDVENVASADLVIKSAPEEGDTVGIGADTYFFGSNPPGGEIAVEQGAGPAIWNAFIDAVNNQGTESVRAIRRGRSVRIERADSPGGSPQVGGAPIALSANFAKDAGAWDSGSLSSGSADITRVRGTRTLTEIDLEKDNIRVTLAVTPRFAEVMVSKQNGLVRRWPFRFDGQDVVILKNPKGRPGSLTVGDIIKWEVLGL